MALFSVGEGTWDDGKGLGQSNHNRESWNQDK